MATRSLNVVITGDSRQLGTASKQAEQHLTGVEKTAKRMGAAVKIGFGAAAAGAVIGIDFLKKSVVAAEEAQASQKRLQTQLKASGISYRAHAKEIDNVIQAHARLAAVDDEDLQDAFTNLVRSTGQVKQSLHDLTLVTDLSRAKNLSLTKTADLLGKVHAGNIGILKRYGIAITPVTEAQDKLRASTTKQIQALQAQAKTATGPAKAAIEARIQGLRAQASQELKAAKATDTAKSGQAAIATLQKRFAGQAEAYGKTAAGAQERFKNAIENLQEAIGQGLLPIITRVTNAVSKFVDQMHSGKGAGGEFSQSMRDLGHALKPVATGLQVSTSWLSKHSTAMKLALNPVTNFVTEMKGLAVVLKAVEDAVRGVVSAVKSIPGLFKGAAGAVSGLVGKLNPFGDGLGRAASSLRLPSGGGSGGSLMGARSSLAPFAAVGGRFGLHVTDGKRPAGTRTSSGGISYHSTGEAIDMGDGRGPDPQKLAYFKYMKSRFGGRLAELIYTPGGAGIKDGRPYNYTGTTAAEHYDHVHVAFDSGVPGIGDGPGRKPGRYAGDGLGFNAVAKLAEGVGLPGVTFAQIARGESGYNPRALGHDPGGTTGYGLWQITSGYNDDIIRKYGGPDAMFNPHTNALAARDIWRRQGKAAWYGTKFVTGWNLHYKGGSGGSGGGSGGGASAVRLTPGQKRARAQFGASQGAARAQARGELGSARAVAADRLLIGPGQGGYGQKVDNAELGQATARSKDNLGGLIRALQSELGLKLKRLKKIRKTLKRRLKPATRKALTEEATTLVGEVGDLQDTLKEYQADQKGGATTITQADALDAGVASASSDTGSTGGGTDSGAGGGGADNSALISAITDLKASIDAQTAFAASVSNTSNFQLTKYLSDVFSQHIVGYGVAGRAFTPGTGVEVAY
jgi:hypothetical protein